MNNNSKKEKEKNNKNLIGFEIGEKKKVNERFSILLVWSKNWNDDNNGDDEEENPLENWTLKSLHYLQKDKRAEKAKVLSLSVKRRDFAFEVNQIERSYFLTLFFNFVSLGVRFISVDFFSSSSSHKFSTRDNAKDRDYGSVWTPTLIRWNWIFG